MTDPTDAVARLAARRGIAPDYRSLTGATIAIPKETQRRILMAMGLAAASDEEAAETEARLAAVAAARRIAPAVVLRSDGGPLRVPVAAGVEPVDTDYRIVLEDGGAIEGRAAFVVGDGPALQLPALPHGYHDLHVPALAGGPSRLIVAPLSCFLPEPIERGEQIKGMAVQSYLLRSDRNWGIGDYTDVAETAAAAGRAGYDILGLNPLHLQFADLPEKASPYDPASRLLLNTLAIDLAALPEFDAADDVRAMMAEDGFAADLAAARAAEFVDYTRVTRLKLPVLRRLYDRFRAGGSADRHAAFGAFRKAGGRTLEMTAAFLVLRRRFVDADGAPQDWSDWPEPYRDPDSPAVAAFVAEEADEVSFEVFLQWVADEQFAAAAAAARDAGMRIGLYRDLAVGCDGSGPETWLDQRAVLKGLSVGAPPDYLNPAGQDWGLPPFDPVALAEDGYRAFAALVGANMRHAGALRIDHVMGLSRLFCIARGDGSDHGAYLSYPLDDLLGVLALESHRHRCLVVGEDLGTLPYGFRGRMAAENVLSYRVMRFEKDYASGAYIKPWDYPRLSVAVAGSHDMPMLRPWWSAADIDLRERLNVFPTADLVEAERAGRRLDRRLLAQALWEEGLIWGPDPDLLNEESFVAAAMHFLYRTASAIRMVQLDDLLDETMPVNIPGTVAHYPNWRRRYRGEAAPVLAASSRSDGA